MRFIAITLLVATVHIVVSVASFTLALSGIGAMTRSEAQNAKASWRLFTVGNCAPIALNQHLKYHVYSPFPKTIGGPNWTQEDQIALWKKNNFQTHVRDLLFLIWPFLVGTVAAYADFLLRSRSIRENHK